MDPLILLMSLGAGVIATLATAVSVMWRSRTVMESWVLDQLRSRDFRIDRLERENSRLAGDQLRDVIAALTAASSAMTALARAVREGPCPRLAGMESDTFHSPTPMSAHKAQGEDSKDHYHG